MSGTYRDRGIVLMSRPGLRDHDRLYSVFTEEHGKVSLVASGSRRVGSKMAPHMATFGVVDLLVAHGKRVERLAGASLVTTWREMSGSADAALVVQTLFLAVDALTRPAVFEPRIFALLMEFCEIVERGEMTGLLFQAALFRVFDVLGFGLELGVCVQCRGVLSEQGNVLNMVRGGVVCGKCRDTVGMRVSVLAIKVLRFMRAEQLGYVGLLRVPEEVCREVGFILEVMMNTHVQWKFPAMVYFNRVTK